MNFFDKHTKLSFGFIQILIFAAFFLMLINGEIGWIIIYACTAAHLISAVLLMISVRNFKAEIKPDFVGLHEKGEPFAVDIVFTKTGFCLLPEINVELSDYASGRTYSARTALIGRKSATVSFECNVPNCGLHNLACSWTTADLLGFIIRENTDDINAYTAILPEPKPIEGVSPIPKTLPDEYDEEHENSAVNSFAGGTPGYENRKYEPGDSPRKINYKLSAKRRELMVRRDESAVSGTTRIFISRFSSCSSAEKAYFVAEEIVRQGGAAEVFHRGKSFYAASPAELEKLREWLAFKIYGLVDAIADNDNDKLVERMDYVFNETLSDEDFFDLRDELFSSN